MTVSAAGSQARDLLGDAHREDTPGRRPLRKQAKLKVTKPKLKFGGVRLNTAKGTATLKVKVPGGGSLTVAGKGVAKVKKKRRRRRR